MLSRLIRRARRDEATAAALYGAIVTQARRPVFYRDMGVPDTVDGRLEMVVLHLVLLLRRLGPEGEAGRARGQDVFDAFTADMDRSLREMGVGDFSVPKKMKAIGQSFYGRREVYGTLLAAGDRAALAEALARNLDLAADAAAWVAGYALAADAALAQQPLAAILAELAFPLPAPT